MQEVFITVLHQFESYIMFQTPVETYETYGKEDHQPKGFWSHGRRRREVSWVATIVGGEEFRKSLRWTKTVRY